MADEARARWEIPRGMIGPAESILAVDPHAKIKALIRYWLSVKPGNWLPGRRDFDPMAVPHLLPNLWIVEVERGPVLRFRYRLMGTAAVKQTAENHTGRYLDEAHGGFADSAFRRYLREVVERGLPSWRIGRSKLFLREDIWGIERIYLPAAHDGATVDMIFALTVRMDRAGREL